MAQEPAWVWKWPGHVSRSRCANPVILFLDGSNMLKWQFSSLHLVVRISSSQIPILCSTMTKPLGSPLLSLSLACIGKNIIWIEISKQTKSFHFKPTSENCFRILNTQGYRKKFNFNQIYYWSCTKYYQVNVLWWQKNPTSLFAEYLDSISPSSDKLKHILEFPKGQKCSFLSSSALLSTSICWLHTEAWSSLFTEKVDTFG